MKESVLGLIERFWQKAGIANLLLGSMPAVVLFFLIPVEIFLPNYGELNYNIVVLAPYLICLLLWSLSLALGLRLVGERWGPTIVLGLFWIGMFLFFSDIIAPVQLDRLDGTQVTPPEPLALTVREAVLAAIIIVAALKLPIPHIRSFGIVFVSLLIVFEFIRVMTGFSKVASHYRKTKPYPVPQTVASTPNIYHLTFDSYHALLFEKAITEVGVSDDFDGFIFFKNNRSNYLFTGLSVASYMTGTFYKSGRMYKWLRMPHEAGIGEELSRRHYVMWNYAHSLPYVHKRASYIHTNVEMMSKQDLPGLVANFADLWLVRVVPNILQSEVYSEGKGAFTRLREIFNDSRETGPPVAVAEQEARAFYSVALARKLIEEEQMRPATGQYIYAHIYLPHGSYIMDERCDYAPGKADYLSQTLCATRLMSLFLRELKRLGRYEESTIIIQSDHAALDSMLDTGAAHGGNQSNPKQLENNVWKAKPNEIDSISRALLLIKPPNNASGGLEVSQKSAQLVDIPATLYDMGQIVPQVPPTEGHSLLDPEFPKDREAHVFLGYRQKNQADQYIFLGRDFKQGELNHFSYSESQGWKRFPNITANW